MKVQVQVRQSPPRAAFALEQAGVHPLMARLLAARGVREVQELDDGLGQLLPPTLLKGAASAATLLADAMEHGRKVVVVADYDCDGATACAVALRGLKMLGASADQLAYVVPDRLVHGYGLTPAIVDASRALQPDLIVTVDNGIASVDGVTHAKACGLQVLITDHHLPAVQHGEVVLPDADVIVNPNQPDDAFASKALAGVGVMFYVLLALRAELRARGRFESHSQPRLDALLDLVALGTVADVARLDANNRRLVAQGLKRIRSGRMQPGVAALFAAAGRSSARASALDFGFALGPRINAAGRLSDMTLGIECLLTDDASRAAELAEQLDRINRDRREVESGMREQAQALMDRWTSASHAESAVPPAVCLHDPAFHEGVVGIVAGRIKERLHRPTFVFATAPGGVLKGSGRSIPGFHLRDALDLVSKRAPGVLVRFGGHAMAAGATVVAAALSEFEAALQAVAREWLSPTDLQKVCLTDGPLDVQWFTPDTARMLDAQVWGQGFEPPLFCDEVEVLQQTLVKDKHLRLRVKHQGIVREAIWFQRTEPVAPRVQLAYRLQADEWNGQQRVQMMVEAAIDAVD